MAENEIIKVSSKIWAKDISKNWEGLIEDFKE